MEKKIILPDTCFCAIVKDEIMNPAGGIVDFINSTMPYCQAGAIVDTGSKDGTREKLEELAGKYKNLKIYDLNLNPFHYADAKNFAISKADTKRIFILDADERLTKKDFSQLYNSLKEDNWNHEGYKFNILDVFNEKTDTGWGLSFRLFNKSSDIRYKGNVWEVFMKGLEPFVEAADWISVPIAVKHFRPNERICELKKEFIYEPMDKGNLDNLFSKKNIEPEKILQLSRLWKEFNPQRENYR